MNFRKATVIASVLVTVSMPVVAFASPATSSAASASGTAVTERRSSRIAASTQASLTPRYITIQQGDTLWDLAHQNGVSVSALERWNHLTDQSTLQLGAHLIIGWGGAKSGLASRSENSSGSLATAVFGAQVVQYAEQFTGTPYAWGGESTSGFDCSGLVRFSFGHFGISLNHSSYGQYQEGVAVARADLLPGDLVFFSSDGSGPSHVGIYVGGHQFINAEDMGVKVDSMDSSYWASHYYGARRVH